MRLLLLLIINTITVHMYAQNDSIIEFTGRIKDSKGKPLTNVNVIIKNKHKSVVSNLDGMFSIVLETQDSVFFSSDGYKKALLIMPDTFKTHYINYEFNMIEDTLFVDPGYIFPWITYEEFKEAVINLKLPEDRDLVNARKNIALIRTQMIFSDEASPEANFKYVMQEQYNKTFIQGQFPSIKLLNPLNWAKFIEAIEKGDFSNSKDVRNIDDEKIDYKEWEKNYNRENN